MSIRILVADDNASVRSAVSEVIRSSGHEWEVCYEASNGQAAIEKAVELRPDLLIIDLLMPFDGISAGREIRKLLPRTPMVLHSIWASPELEREATKAGFQVVAQKTNSAALISAIHEALLARI